MDKKENTKLATIFAFSRMCKAYWNLDCRANCPFGSNHNPSNVPCHLFIANYPYEANKRLIEWCENNPQEVVIKKQRKGKAGD
mgnify:CR=1 FL=1